MISWIDLGMAFTIGLAGSIHCVGMCGGVVAALSMGRRGAWLPGLISYHAGRIATYSALGLAAGLLGSLVSGGGSLIAVQSGLSIAAGVIMTIFALQIGGWIPERFGPLSRIGIPPGLLGRVAEGDSILVWGLIGLANGLLPCGMVYAALAFALKQTNPLLGIFMMASFGIGTVPTMTGFSIIIKKWDSSLRGRFLKWTAIILILFGLFTIARGLIPPAGHRHERVEQSSERSTAIHKTAHVN